jgi:ketosteroid isomerase-like protein
MMLTGTAHAQQDERQAVKETIYALFDAMRAGDSATVRRVLSPDIRMCSSVEQLNNTRWKCEDSPEGFIRAVGSPHDAIWDERISGLKIQVDGRLASAWMKYDFYLGDTFHHKGVDVMTLYQTDAGWQIVWLADTRH